MDFFDWFVIIALIAFYIAFIGKTVIMAIKDRINPFVLGKGKSGLNRFVEILFFAGLILWTYAAVAQALRFNPPSLLKIIFWPWVQSKILPWMGVILITAGIVFFIVTLNDFGKSWRVGIDKDNAGKLVTTGVFSISRNPIFLFVDIFFAGIAMIYSNPFFILAAVVVIVGIHYQILQEEKFLLSKYGDVYEAYKSKVRRYI